MPAKGGNLSRKNLSRKPALIPEVDDERFDQEKGLPPVILQFYEAEPPAGLTKAVQYYLKHRHDKLSDREKQHMTAQAASLAYEMVFIRRGRIILGRKAPELTYHIIGEREMSNISRDFYEGMWGAWTDAVLRSTADSIKSSIRKEMDEVDNRYVQITDRYTWDSATGQFVEPGKMEEKPFIFRKLFDTGYTSKNVVKVPPLTKEDELELMSQYEAYLTLLNDENGHGLVGDYTPDLAPIITWADEVDEVALDIMRAMAYCFIKNKPVGAYCLIGSRRNGKSPISNDTPVLARRNGAVQWLKHGDLMVGDEVMSWEGKFADVIKTVPYKSQKMYRFTLQDGRTVKAAEDHIWSVVKEHNLRGIGRYDMDKFEEKTTAELLDSRYKWYLPPTQPVELPAQDLPIDPYVLGVIIGDANIYSADSKQTGYIQISGEDKEIVGLFNNCRVSEDRSIRKTIYVARTNQYAEQCISLGLAGKKSYEKEIPEQYMFGSVEQRKALLAGLLDTDGTISHAQSNSHINQVEFSTSSEKLAKQVRSLVFSLGGSATIHKRMGRYVKDGKHIETRCNYRLFIRVIENPFRLERKAVCWHLPKRLGYTAIKSIEFIGNEDCQCIAIDTPSHLYLVTDSHIPTHNTFIGLLNTLVGNKNTSNVRLSELGDPHFAHQLAGTFVNATDEEDESPTKFQASFKTMADHGVLSLSTMYSQEPLQVSCDFMSFFPMNHIPEWTGSGAAACVARTWAIPFFADLSKFDTDTKNFAEETFTKEFMIQLAAEVFALATYYTTHEPVKSKTMEMMQTSIEEEVDSVIVFKTKFEKYFDGFQSWNGIFDDYVIWCKQNDYKICPLKTFKFHWAQYRTGGRVKVYIGNKQIACYVRKNRRPNYPVLSEFSEVNGYTLDKAHDNGWSFVTQAEVDEEDARQRGLLEDDE